MQRLVTALLLYCAVSNERIRIDPKTGYYIDKDGRARIFHGVNVVTKRPPWHPSIGSFDANSSLNSQDMLNLKKWGFNVVRLGVQWQGVEPTMGNYDDNYLSIMLQIAEDLYKHGIYTIVDFHQDSLAEAWCGQGIPTWLVPMLEPLTTSCTGIVSKIGELIGECRTFASYKIPIDPETGYPKIHGAGGCLERTFDQYSRCPELVSAWGNFYSNETIQQKFRAMWSRVATEFAGSPGVLGYDLVNEPLNGDFYGDVKRLIPGFLDEHVLQPMYQSLHDVIREVDPEGIIMYEPPPFPDTYPSNVPFAGGVHSTGFTEGPAKEDKAHQALSYHIYSCGFAVQDCDREGDTVSIDCPICDKWAEAAVSLRDGDAKRLGGGVFLTEFGACSGTDKCLAEIKRVLDNADTAMHSWAYWQFKYYEDITTIAGPLEGFYYNNGSLQTRKVAALSRTYAPAIAGHPLLMKYDAETGAFRLRYDAVDSDHELQTEIFLNKEMNYAGGKYHIEVINGTYVEKGENRLYVIASARGPVDVAIIRPQLLGDSASGAVGELHVKKWGDFIKWRVSEDHDREKPGFEFSTNNNITWSKQMKVYSDDGRLLCSLSLQDEHHGPLGCDLKEEHKHDLLFNYRIEMWRARALGMHRHVHTISSSTFGPLLGKRIHFTWVDDHEKLEDKDISPEVVV